MGGLLYYRPGPDKLADGEMKSLGVAHAFEERQPSLRGVMKGPDGKGGLIIADPDRLGNLSVGYYPEDQEWRETGVNGLQVGWYRDHFSIESLQRDSILPGTKIKLSDRRRWQIPRLRQWDAMQGAGICQLPTSLKHDGKGWKFGDVKAEYSEIWELAENYWARLIAAVFNQEAEKGSVEFSFDGMADFAVAVLSLNYVVTPLEVSALELFDDTTPQLIADTAVDWSTFLDWLIKKNEQDDAGDNTSAGDEG